MDEILPQLMYSDAADRKLRLYEAILDATPDLVYVFDRQHRFTYANHALLTMWGRHWDDAIGKTCLELGYEPWHAAMHDEEIERVIATRRPVRGDVPFNGTGGRRIYDYIFVPVIGPDGEVEAIAGTTRDVTERKQDEEARRVSEERLRAMASASSDAIYRMSADWEVVQVLVGKDAVERRDIAVGGWLSSRIHPDDRERVMAAVEHAKQSQTPMEIEHRILQSGARSSWVASRVVPILQPDGTVREWVGAVTDIDERKRHEEHQQLLMNELNHRVKNTLAVVQSMALQTLKGCDSVALASARFEARIMALSKAHEILTQTSWKGATLDEVVAGAVAPCLEEGAGRFDIGGPPIHLTPRRVLALSMALHELCTNALKYGALSNESGKVRIAWRVRDDGPQPMLELLWRESGGPPVIVPATPGFGTRLVQRGLKHDLAGNVALDFLPEGVTCRIEAPMEGVAA